MRSRSCHMQFYPLKRMYDARANRRGWLSLSCCSTSSTQPWCGGWPNGAGRRWDHGLFVRRRARSRAGDRVLAGGPGFEPRLPGSEPGVLPLNYPPSGMRGPAAISSGPPGRATVPEMWACPRPPAAPPNRMAESRGGRRPAMRRSSRHRPPVRAARFADPAFAALDLGTNNCRLLVGRPAGEGFRVLDSFSRIVRLGEGLHDTGRLSPTAMDRTLAALACLRRPGWRAARCARVRAIATEACRRAANGAEFLARARRETGLRDRRHLGPRGSRTRARKLRPADLGGRPARAAVRHRRRLDGIRLGPARGRRPAGTRSATTRCRSASSPWPSASALPAHTAGVLRGDGRRGRGAACRLRGDPLHRPRDPAGRGPAARHQRHRNHAGGRRAGPDALPPPAGGRHGAEPRGGGQRARQPSGASAATDWSGTPASGRSGPSSCCPAARSSRRSSAAGRRLPWSWPTGDCGRGCCCA